MLCGSSPPVSSARRLFRLHASLAAIGAAAVAAGIVVALTTIELGIPSADALLAACRRVVPAERGVGLLLVWALGALGLVVLISGLRSLVRQLRLQRKFLRGLPPAAAIAVGERELTVIESSTPEAFCAGLLRPRIYISKAAVERLTEEELRAVVAHEAHHQRSRDPLRVFAGTVLSEAIFFLPGLRRVGERYRELAELAADEAASKAAGAQALASALLTFGQDRGTRPAVVGIAPERIDHLLGRSPRWQLGPSLLGGLLIILTLWLGLGLTAPALLGSASTSPGALLAETCMVGMAILPLAILVAALFHLRSRGLPFTSWR